MNNAEKFQEVFNIYATEFWAKPEPELLKWLNEEYNPTTEEINNNFFPLEYKYNDNYFPSECDYCSNNPKNGGSGICNCTIGIKNIITS